MNTMVSIGAIIVVIIIAAVAFLALGFGGAPSSTNSSSHNPPAGSQTARTGYNTSGYNSSGYNASGVNKTGFNSTGTNKTGQPNIPAPLYTVTVYDNSSVGGNYLANATGYALYLYTPDNDSNTSICTGTCATNWPPFYAANITVPSGLNASSFGTITRSDGSMQTTYKGWPLYYFIGDKAPGEVTGQGVGKVFYVVNVPVIILP